MKELEEFLSTHKDSQDYQDFDYGQVNLSTFVDEQFQFNMDDEGCENSAKWREKVASNFLVVKNILSHVNFSTLKIARLVCKEWNSLTNFELGRRNCCHMRFQPNFLLKKDLKLEFLRNSVDLSWMEFDLENLDEMELEYMATFCGSQIKILKICLENFALVNSFFNAGEFHNVKILSFHEDFEDSGNSDVTTKTENPLAREFQNLLKLLREESNSNSTSSKAKANQKPQLERLLVGNQDFEDHPEFLDQVNGILESNQETLKFLDLPLSFSSSSSSTLRLGIPGKLSQVSVIHFHINCKKKNEIGIQRFQLPQGFEQRNLPNLKTVRFEFNHRVDWWKSCHFLPPEKTKTGSKNCLSLSSVINLEVGYKTDCRSDWLHQFRPFKWLPWFSALFPSIQSVIIDSWTNEDKVLRHVFKVWPNLTSLEIRSHFCSQASSTSLDSVFTGLSQEKCEELRKNPEPVPTSIEMEIAELKTEPNINSLKELKRLEICCFGSSLSCPVSKISWLYAFDLNPELKVRIYRFSEAIKKCKCCFP